MTHSNLSTGAIDADTAYRVFRAAERRAVLAHFLEADSRVTNLEPLASHVAAYQYDNGAETDSLGMILLELIHQHLPQLEAAGLIEFDLRSETVVATETIEAIRPLFDAAVHFDRP